MPDETPEGGESGGSIRSKLETALTESRELAKQLKVYKAKDEITTKQYRYVTADDLKDVDLAELSTKAAEIEKVRAEQEAQVARNILARQGVPEADLDAAVAKFLAPAETQDDPAARVASLARIQGGAPVLPSHAEGRDLLVEHFTAQEKRSPSR